jgi:hypothetical protein
VLARGAILPIHIADPMALLTPVTGPGQVPIREVPPVPVGIPPVIVNLQ